MQQDHHVVLFTETGKLILERNCFAYIFETASSCCVCLQELMQHDLRSCITANIVGTPLTSEIHLGKAKGRRSYF